MLLSAEQHGAMVFHVLEHDYHRPFVDGKSNKDNIQEEIVMGLYKKEIPPCDQEDVDWIVEMVDSMIMEHGANK